MSDQNSHGGHGEDSGALSDRSQNTPDGMGASGNRDTSMTPPDNRGVGASGDAVYRGGHSATSFPAGFDRTGFPGYQGTLPPGAVGGLVGGQRQAGGVPAMPGWGTGSIPAWPDGGAHAAPMDRRSMQQASSDDVSASQQHLEMSADDSGHQDGSHAGEPMVEDHWDDGAGVSKADGMDEENLDADGGDDHGADHLSEGEADFDDRYDDLEGPDLAVGGVERKKSMPLVGKAIFGGGAVLIVGAVGYIMASSVLSMVPAGSAETVRLEEMDPREALPAMPKISVVDPMTAMVAVRPPAGVSTVGDVRRDNTALPASPLPVAAKPHAEMPGIGGQATGAGDGAGAVVPGPALVAATPIPVSTPTLENALGTPLHGGMGGMTPPATVPTGQGAAPTVSNEQVMAAVTGLVTQVSLLSTKVDAGTKPAGEDPSIAGLKAEIAAMRAQIASLQTVSAKPAAVMPEPTKAPASTHSRQRAALPAQARQPKQTRQDASADRDASHKGCKLLGATDATFGGTGGTAWISTGKQEAKQVEVGGRAPCIGVVKSIFPDGTTWVVRGSGGTLRLSNGS